MKHGTNGYSNYGCRCDVCREAWRLYYHERKYRYIQQRKNHSKKLWASLSLEEKNKQREARKRRRRSILKAIQDLKEENPCLDCEEYYPYFVMDYHHRDPETKERCIATMVQRGVRLDKILQEIDKCDLLCSNCHRLREFYARGLHLLGKDAIMV